MEEEGLIERRRARNHLRRSGLYRLTAKGAAAKRNLGESRLEGAQKKNFSNGQFDPSAFSQGPRS